MKYIRIISTLILLVYIAHLSDTIYVEYFKPTLETMSGFSKAAYALFLFLPRFIIGVALGVNLVRISNFIWNKND